MVKLDLEFSNLENIFEIDFTAKVITLKLDENGDMRTSFNTQQLYNWYRNKQLEAMWSRNLITGAGFIGLQPVIQFLHNLKIKIPNIPKFVVNGLISSEEEGNIPFIVEASTVIVMSQYARPHSKLFLSHSSVNKPFVRELRSGLYSICETFFDETDIHFGESISNRLNEELLSSDALVLIFSKDASNSKWVQREWTSMLHMNKTIIVVRIDDEPIPPLLIDIKYIDYKDNIQQVCDDISIALGEI